MKVWVRGGTPGSGTGRRSGGETTNSEAPAEEWREDGEITLKEGRKTGDLWAPALSHEGRYLVGTTIDGKLNVWDLKAGEADGKMERVKMMTLQTKGSFGVCCDMVGFGSPLRS